MSSEPLSSPSHEETCLHCNGTGAEPYARDFLCHWCNGAGTVPPITNERIRSTEKLLAFFSASE